MSDQASSSHAPLPPTDATVMAHREQSHSDIDVLRASLGQEALPFYLDRQAVQAALDAAHRWPRLVNYARTHDATRVDEPASQAVIR